MAEPNPELVALAQQAAADPNNPHAVAAQNDKWNAALGTQGVLPPQAPMGPPSPSPAEMQGQYPAPLKADARQETEEEKDARLEKEQDAVAQVKTAGLNLPPGQTGQVAPVVLPGQVHPAVPGAVATKPG